MCTLTHISCMSIHTRRDSKSIRLCQLAHHWAELYFPAEMEKNHWKLKLKLAPEVYMLAMMNSLCYIICLAGPISQMTKMVIITSQDASCPLTINSLPCLHTFSNPWSLGTSPYLLTPPPSSPLLYPLAALQNHLHFLFPLLHQTTICIKVAKVISTGLCILSCSVINLLWLGGSIFTAG